MYQEGAGRIILFKRQDMKEQREYYGPILTWWIIIVILAFVILLVACDKPEYCYECHREDGGIITYCGYSDSLFDAVYEYNCKIFKDTMDCRLIEKP